MEQEFERKIALCTAEEVFAGKLDILNGCRRLAHELVCADLGNDPAYQLFRAVASKSDELPIGSDRQHWNAEVLKRKDEEIESLAKFYRDDVLTACRELIERHSGSPATHESS